MAAGERHGGAAEELHARTAALAAPCSSGGGAWRQRGRGMAVRWRGVAARRWRGSSRARSSPYFGDFFLRFCDVNFWRFCHVNFWRFCDVNL